MESVYLGHITHIFERNFPVVSNSWVTFFCLHDCLSSGKQESIQQDNNINKQLISDKKFQWQNAQASFNPDMKPIGFVQSCFKEKNGIPRQPSVCPGAKAKLCVSVKGFTNPEHSLDGLQNFSHVW